MSKQNAKSKHSDTERAAEWYTREVHRCLITRRAVRTKWQKVDFFGADVMGKRVDGTHVYVQATAGQDSAVTARRRKLELIPWHETDTVEIVQLIQTEDPANARKKLWFFRVHCYQHREAKGFRLWHTKDKAIPIPREWFRAWKE